MAGYQVKVARLTPLNVPQLGHVDATSRWGRILVRRLRNNPSQPCVDGNAR